MPRKSLPQGLAEPKTAYTAPVAEGENAPGRRKLPPPETLPDGTVRYFLVAGPKGRVLVPAEMRAAMDLQEGDVITAWLKDGEVRMHSHAHGLRKIQREAALMAKGSKYASEELIAERRAEAAKEDEDDRRDRAQKKRR